MTTAIGVLFVLFCIFAVVARYGVLFPRLGRWLDARIYRAFPRIGHVFITEAQAPEAQEAGTEAPS